MELQHYYQLIKSLLETSVVDPNPFKKRDPLDSETKLKENN